MSSVDAKSNLLGINVKGDNGRKGEFPISLQYQL